MDIVQMEQYVSQGRLIPDDLRNTQNNKPSNKILFRSRAWGLITGRPYLINK